MNSSSTPEGPGSVAGAPLQPRVIGDPPGADRVVLDLPGRPRRGRVPVLGPGVHAPQRFLACLLAGRRKGEEHAQVSLWAAFPRADRVATPDLATQRRPARQIEWLLLDETPIIYAYFYDWLNATQKNVTGVYPAATGLFLWNAART
jgi:hypothetical protein